MTDRAVPQYEGTFAPVIYCDRGIDLLDQTLIPERSAVFFLTAIEGVAVEIRTMRVRGARRLLQGLRWLVSPSPDILMPQ